MTEKETPQKKTVPLFGTETWFAVSLIGLQISKNALLDLALMKMRRIKI